MLVTSRPRGFPMKDHDEETEAGQGSLFAPESLAPAPHPARPPSPTPDPFAPPPRRPATDVHAEPAAAPDTEPALERDLTPHRRAVPLAGPTLDDVVCRVWEGMRAEVPTPCPVCHTEIEPSMHGRCGACGSTLD
jgi:hypothetical protein